MIALKRILVPHDFSDPSTVATTHAVAFARQFGAELAFLYVADTTRTELEREIPGADEGPVADTVRARLLSTIAPADQAVIKPEFFVRVGTPAAEITRFAAEHDIDLIVMGTHGRGFIGHVVMGSVAEKVVRSAPCPVLTVRSHEVAQGVSVPVAMAADRTEAAV